MDQGYIWIGLAGCSLATACIAVGVVKWKTNPRCYRDYSKLQQDLEDSRSGGNLLDIVIEGKIKPEENTAPSDESISSHGPAGFVVDMGNIRLNPDRKVGWIETINGSPEVPLQYAHKEAMTETNKLDPKNFSFPFILKDETTNKTIKVKEIDISNGFRSLHNDITSPKEWTESTNSGYYIRSGIQYRLIMYGSMAAILGDAKKSPDKDIVCEFIPKEVAKSAESFITIPKFNGTSTLLIITGVLLAITTLLFWMKRIRDNRNQAGELGNQPEQQDQPSDNDNKNNCNMPT